MEEADALNWPPKIEKYRILKQVVKKIKKNPNFYQYTYQTFSMLPMR